MNTEVYDRENGMILLFVSMVCSFMTCELRWVLAMILFLPVSRQSANHSHKIVKLAVQGHFWFL